MPRTPKPVRNPLLTVAAFQPIGEALTLDLITLCWLGYAAALDGTLRGTHLTRYTRHLVRCMYVINLSRNDRLMKLAGKAMQAWLDAAERCDRKGMQYVTLTADEATRLRKTFEILELAIPQLPLKAYIAAQQRINKDDIAIAAAA